MKTTSTVRRGDLIVGFLLFSGCAADKDGNCNAVKDFVVVAPDGSEYARQDGAELWVGKEPPPYPQMQLGTAYLGIIIEPQDLLGVYSLRARVCDRVSEVCLDLSQTFRATHILAEYDLDTLMDRYYLDPRPELISRAIAEIGEQKLLEDPNAVPPTIAFFSEVFSANEDRIPEWKRLIDEQEERTRALLLAALETSVDPPVVRSTSNPSPSQNDIFWGAFLASGDTKYIDAIIENAAFDSERNDLVLYMTAASAKWSLSSILRHHVLVKLHVEGRLADSDERTASILRKTRGQRPKPKVKDLPTL